jgi:7-carboxy-7-deazaguanine synthase
MKVNDLYLSVQGEGVHTGVPMVVLRLMGCPVGCPFCDTKETWTAESTAEVNSFLGLASGAPHWVDVSERAIAERVTVMHPRAVRWVLVTGGEPAMQDLGPLVAALQAVGRKVAIETSGTADGVIGCGADWVTVSPKIDMPGGRCILPEAVAEAHEIKWVVGREEDTWKLKAFLAEHEGRLRSDLAVCVQPMSKSPTATELCIRLAIEQGWRLSVQVHRYIGVL